MLTPYVDRQRILVPADLSGFSRLTLKAALHLAQAPQDLVHAFYLPGLYANSGEDLALLENPFSRTPQLASQRFLEWAQAEGNESVLRPLPLMGIPDARVIADMASRLESTLIVVMRRRYTFWQHLFRSAAIEQLPRLAPCPLHFVDGTEPSAQVREPE